MARPKFSPSEIVARLQLIEALEADGQPIADAIRFAGMLPLEYDRWRSEYAGLLRTLGPLPCTPSKVKPRGAGHGRQVRTIK